MGFRGFEGPNDASEAKPLQLQQSEIFGIPSHKPLTGLEGRPLRGRGEARRGRVCPIFVLNEVGIKGSKGHTRKGHKEKHPEITLKLTENTLKFRGFEKGLTGGD